MGRTVLKYSFITIGIYLGFAYATGAGKLLTAGSQGATNVIKAFQGRS